MRTGGRRIALPILAGFRTSLERRLLLLAGTGLVVAFGLFAGLSNWSINEATDRSLRERQIIAETAADRVAYLLRDNLEELQTAAFATQVNGDRGSLEEIRPLLHDISLRTMFSDGIYILDGSGTLVLGEPQDGRIMAPERLSYARRALDSGKPVVSDLYRSTISGKPILFVMIPLHDREGWINGVLGGDLDPTDRRFQEVMRSISEAATGYAQLVDTAGNVLAGEGAGELAPTHESERMAAFVATRRSGVFACHQCHQIGKEVVRQAEVASFAPVEGAPWTVVVRQLESEAFLPEYRLRSILLLAGLPLLAISLVVAWATARSIVRPIASLARSAEAIAGDDLSVAVPQAGADEIGRLARTFEAMRSRLQDSLWHIQGWNAELEKRVRERTVQLQEQEKAGRELLRKLISAQEEERRRIARELHDETSQSLAALILALETAAIRSDTTQEVTSRLGDLKSLAVDILDGVHEIIYDLRPSLLDDLGLVAAIRWYAESRLQAVGIDVAVETVGAERRLPAEIETILFRVLQEAIINVAKHSNADTALVRFEIAEDLVSAEVEDDGRGFDPAAIHPEARAMQGLGLLGMQERIGLVKGKMIVVSRPGHGTRLQFSVPLLPLDCAVPLEQDGENYPSVASR